MSDKAKKIFLIASIAVPFFIYCVYYYSMMVRDAPYKFSEFDSFTFQYGVKDSMINKYDSKTGDYQFLNSRDSLEKVHMRISKDNLLYLHRKAADLGLWDFPSSERGDSTSLVNGAKPVRYLIEFNYKRKSKKVVFDSDFFGDPRLKDANIRLIKEIQMVLAEEESKHKK
jgi:hypothetical protein